MSPQLIAASSRHAPPSARRAVSARSSLYLSPNPNIVVPLKLQQLRTDQRKAVHCSRPGQHQRVLPLSACMLFPLSQNSPRDPEADFMKPAVEPRAIKGARIDLPRPLSYRSDSGSLVSPSR